MVRQLLGNIKGPKGNTGEKGDRGEQGIQGPPGTLANESIGVVNLLDVTEPENLQSGNTWEFDEETGVVNYNFTTGQFIYFEVELEPRVHTFRIQDFTVNTLYNGDFRFQLRDSDREYIHITNVSKKGRYNFDLTSYGTTQTFEVYFYREAGSGFFEKPMLVEGDISVLWNPPQKLKREYYLTANLSGSIPYSSNLSDKQELTIFGSPDGWDNDTKRLTLPSGGTYQIFVSVTPSTLKSGLVQIEIRNGTVVLNSFRGTAPNTIVCFGAISTISAIPRINIVATQSIADEEISLMGSGSSKIFIKKLPN